MLSNSLLFCTCVQPKYTRCRHLLKPSNRRRRLSYAVQISLDLRKFAMVRLDRSSCTQCVAMSFGRLYVES